jgi:hypothetical protein
MNYNRHGILFCKWGHVVYDQKLNWSKNVGIVIN